MGHQIAMQFARYGFSTTGMDTNAEVLDNARAFAEKWSKKQVAKSRMTQQQSDEMTGRLRFTSDLTDAAKDADLVVEAIVEKEPTLINKEIYGFVVNRIFSAITQEACSLLDQGVASIEGIDNAVRNGLGHPIGPFQLLDLTGIDLEYTVLMEKYKETGSSSDKPSPAIVERYARDEYGKKTGKGFYDYHK
jgi:3-hydroxyacyl-CoA dehydrogenase